MKITPKFYKYRRQIVIVFYIGALGGCYRPSSPTSLGKFTSSPTIEKLRTRVDLVLASVREQRELNVDVHAAWQVLHGMLAYGRDFPLRVQGNEVSAVDYLLEGGRLNGWQFSPGDRLDNGRIGLRAALDPGSSRGQGHADQWLAVLAQCGLPLEQTLRVQGAEYRIEDYLAQVQRDLPHNAEEEWSWTLIALTRYLPTDTEWEAQDGSTWNIERLVTSETQQALSASACGGTHRLIGISMALDQRRSEKAKMTSSSWGAAERLVRESARRAREFQNMDGSFSTNYFQRPGISSDSAQILATTGHTLEFLALSLSPEELREEWVLRAVQRLCEVLEETQELPLECGALYHAVHGLVIFRQKALAL